jgi:hypothetical protein
MKMSLSCNYCTLLYTEYYNLLPFSLLTTLHYVELAPHLPQMCIRQLFPYNLGLGMLVQTWARFIFIIMYEVPCKYRDLFESSPKGKYINIRTLHIQSYENYVSTSLPFFE